MQKKIILGNWKMNNTLYESINEFKCITEEIKKNKYLQDTVIGIAPPYVYINILKALLYDEQDGMVNNIVIGAQNCNEESFGAFTGEISAPMLKSIGTDFVIIGHSERRINYNETNHMINAKTKQALKYGLMPVVCCGETLETRNNKTHKEFVKKQIAKSLTDLSSELIQKIVIAYEPIWAIGSGTHATAIDIQEMTTCIKEEVAAIYKIDDINDIKVIYGGSCNENNTKEILSCKNLDGLLVGKASIKHETFIPILLNLI